MFVDDPKNALSVARTHQEALVQREHRDRLGRQARAAQTEASRPGLSQWWQFRRFLGSWRKARASRPAASVRGKPPLPE